jgi:putative intracellular protease/amidase
MPVNSIPIRRKTCYVFLSEDYADWEISLLMAGLHSFGGVEVITFSLTNDPVSSMGNLAVLPDLCLEEIDPSDVDILVLPGSPLWEKGENQEVADLVHTVLRLNKGLAAICGATLFLAREGLLDACWHTSNDFGYLKTQAPGYQGAGRYTGEPSTRDGQIITAGGPFAFQFARDIFQYLDVTEDPFFREWFSYFETGEAVLKRSGTISLFGVS